MVRNPVNVPHNRSENNNVTNCVWQDRCIKERRHATTSAQWSLNEAFIKRYCITPKVNMRRERFLDRDAVMLETLSRMSHQTKRNPNPGNPCHMDPNAPPPVEPTAPQQKEPPSHAGNREISGTTADEIPRRPIRDPKWKHPMATSDDYGWMPSALKSWGHPDRRFYHPLSSSDVSRAATASLRR